MRKWPYRTSLYLASHRATVIIFSCKWRHYRVYVSLRNVVVTARSLYVSYNIAKLWDNRSDVSSSHHVCQPPIRVAGVWAGHRGLPVWASLWRGLQSRRGPSRSYHRVTRSHPETHCPLGKILSRLLQQARCLNIYSSFQVDRCLFDKINTVNFGLRTVTLSQSQIISKSKSE